MTTSVLDRPLDCAADEFDNNDEDGVTHVICCNDDEAICGEDVAMGVWAGEDTAVFPDCLDCEAIEEGFVVWVCPWCKKSNKERFGGR